MNSKKLLQLDDSDIRTLKTGLYRMAMGQSALALELDKLAKADCRTNAEFLKDADLRITELTLDLEEVSRLLEHESRIAVRLDKRLRAIRLLCEFAVADDSTEYLEGRLSLAAEILSALEGK